MKMHSNSYVSGELREQSFENQLYYARHSSVFLFWDERI